MLVTAHGTQEGIGPKRQGKRWHRADPYLRKPLARLCSWDEDV